MGSNAQRTELERMPAGLFEMVGESGWQLSHGERSRLFMARTLLQQGELVVLDESFAALDPATRQIAHRRALARGGVERGAVAQGLPTTACPALLKTRPPTLQPGASTAPCT